MQLTPKIIQVFHERIRIDEDDCWIWQGLVEAGVPLINYNNNYYDAREFAFYVVGQTPPVTNSKWKNQYNMKLDVNPAHNSGDFTETNKYRGIDNEDLGKPHSRGNSTKPRDGNGQSAE